MRIALTVLLACLLSVWAVATFVIDSHAGPFRMLAERLERMPEGERDPRYMTRIEEAIADNAILSLCSREIARSAVSIRLAILDAAYHAEDAAAWQRALDNAEDALRRSLQCFPRDGNFWLRLAMVEYARNGPTKAVEEMLQASHAAAASERWVIAPRAIFALRLASSELSGVDGVLHADIDALVGYGLASDVAHLYASAGEPARKAIQDRIEGLDEERRDAINGAIAREISDAGPNK